MSEKQFLVLDDRKEILVAAFSIAENCRGPKSQAATCYTLTEERGLTFYSTPPEFPKLTIPVIPSLFPYNAEEMALVTWLWLEKQAEYPKEPNIDGSTKKGFLIERRYNDSWPLIVSVKPEWTEYHK
jgi:hypothetical protein